VNSCSGGRWPRLRALGEIAQQGLHSFLPTFEPLLRTADSRFPKTAVRFRSARPAVAPYQDVVFPMLSGSLQAEVLIFGSGNRSVTFFAKAKKGFCLPVFEAREHYRPNVES
jgi:hypothetical protein